VLLKLTNKSKEDVFIAETNFQAKTEKFKRDMEALRVWEIQLKDERDTLERERNRG
jgi:formate hydrogenlyase subunit 6/NADH:ubiquinone oxidoreductase subunit I